MTIREWIEQFYARKNQHPTQIVLGWEHGWGDYKADEWPEWDGWDRLVNVDEMPSEIMDHEFNDGFGGNNSPNLCAWSEDWVLFSDNYDGAEGICWVPRNPVAHSPARPGGG